MTMLLHFVLLLIRMRLISCLSSNTRPGCQSHCGSMEIPYPFGVGADCSLEPSFVILCNTTTDPPAPYLEVTNTQVITINESSIRINYPNLAYACYNLSDYQRGINVTDSDSIFIDFSNTQYTLSAENGLIAYGCEDMVVGDASVGGGCVSFCSGRGGSGYCPDNVNAYLPGNGCCRTPILKGTSRLRAGLLDIHGYWRKSKLFQCSYAFVEEKRSGSYVYPLEYLDNSTAFRNGAPTVVIDWRIGSDNCTQAQTRLNSTTFVCGDNADCVDFEANNVDGYLCYCKLGYQGNPYLSPGCQDINECRFPNKCLLGHCVNTIGHYICSCPKSYVGDGTKDGTGCTHQRSKFINFAMGLASASGLVIVLSMCLLLHKLLKKRKKKMLKAKFFKRNGGIILQQQTSNQGLHTKTNLFSSKELEKATDNFNESRILGQGGQGTVYKGMLLDGKIVAIKKSKLVDEDQLQVFINEVVILSQIIHRNVVQLLGCCLETEVPLLVYEYVPNGTLFDLLHDPISIFCVPWSMRLKIAADVAGALSYLHFASSLPIFHRDVKSSNILLDEKYIVKVADFGTSKSVAVDQTHVTTLVKGTFGYLDPEYFQSNQFTDKSDVYSFGVVLVELLTGKKPICSRGAEEERSLVTRFLKCMEDNRLGVILDSQVSEDEAIAAAGIAQRCLNLRGVMRPSMKEVATDLESLRMSQMPPIAKDEDEYSGTCEARIMMVPEDEYTWTTSGKSGTSSSLDDTHPFITV